MTVALGVGSRAGAGRPLAGDPGYWTVMRGDRSRRTCGGFCGTAQTGDHGGQTAVRYTHRTSPSHTVETSTLSVNSSSCNVGLLF